MREALQANLDIGKRAGHARAIAEGGKPKLGCGETADQE